MKIVTVVTTYERERTLEQLLNQIFQQKKEDGLDMVVLVFDDHSVTYDTNRMKDLVESNGGSWSRFNFNLGKKGHWKMIDCIWQMIKGSDFDFYFHLQDDIKLDPHFFTKMIEEFQAIPDETKVCLNPRVEESRLGRCWTPVNPIVHANGKKKFRRVGWMDLVFMANKKFFQQLNWTIYPVAEQRWQMNPLLSSGVGRQISHRLYRKRLGMWQTFTSLVDHGHVKSQMNPEARQKNPLKTIKQQSK